MMCISVGDFIAIPLSRSPCGFGKRTCGWSEVRRLVIGHVSSILILASLPVAALAANATPQKTRPAAPAPATKGVDAGEPIGAKPPATAIEKSASSERSVVTLNDGQTLRGVVSYPRPGQVVVRLHSGASVTLPASAIASIRIDLRTTIDLKGKLRFADPNRTRYFYSPSAFSLRSGECYFSQKQLFFSSIACGVTDNVSVLVGGMVPLWVTVRGFNIIVAAKAGVKLAKNVHISAGFETLVLPFLSRLAGVGFFFGNVTFGSRDAHVTVAAGRPIALSASQIDTGSAIVTVGGNFRVSAGLALMTENWIINIRRKFEVISAFGVRMLGEHHSVDIALIFLPTTDLGIALPWLDYTYNF